MGASSSHGDEQEWDLVEEPRCVVCGSFQTHLSLAIQTHKGHPSGHQNAMIDSHCNHFGPYRYRTVASSEMTPNEIEIETASQPLLGFFQECLKVMPIKEQRLEQVIQRSTNTLKMNAPSRGVITLVGYSAVCMSTTRMRIGTI